MLNFWARLIQVSAAIVLGLSSVLLLAPSLGEAVFYLVYFHQSDSPVPVPAEVHSYLRFANGILGAVMAGWMISIIMLAQGPLRAGERYGWNAIAWPLLAWYCIDTVFSIMHGVWGNVLLNTGTMLLFGIPLLAVRKHLARRG